MQLPPSFKAALLRGAALQRTGGGPVGPRGGPAAAAGFSSREGPAETGPPSPDFGMQPAGDSGGGGGKREGDMPVGGPTTTTTSSTAGGSGSSSGDGEPAPPPPHAPHRLVDPADAPVTDEDGGSELPPGHDGSGSTLTDTADQTDA